MSEPTLLDLDRELVAFFADDASESRDDAAFNALALRVFAAQYEAIAGYRAYCQKRSALPARLRHWTEIPAVPVQAFRDVRFVADDAGAPARVFRTSGTTGARPGEHYMTPAALALYEASLVATFRAFVLPDAPLGARSPLVPLALLPPPEQAQHSSLGFMVERAGAELFTESPRYFLRDGALDVPGFGSAAAEAARAKRGVCVLTTDLALDRLLGALESRDARIALPAGSRVMRTGGSKGLRAAIDPAALLARVKARLGVAPEACVGEYGMTELCSQFYDDALVTGRAVPLPRPMRGPAWTRTLVVDPHTLEWLPAGRPGLLRVWDLANRGSIVCLQSEDLAVIDAPAAEDDAAGEDTSRATLIALGSAPFRLLGRAPGTEPRGCSLEAEVPAA
jgi:hypothetical protein